MLNDKLEGLLDLWLAPKKYGFIYSGNERFFVHASAIISGDPQTGKSVRFIKGTTRRGAIALDVEVLGGAQ